MSSDDASFTREILKFLCIRYLGEDDTFFSSSSLKKAWRCFIEEHRGLFLTFHGCFVLLESDILGSYCAVAFHSLFPLM
jgi:hypothetical protein